MTDLSRRRFVALTVTGAVAGHVASPFALGFESPAAAVTAGEIVERIKQRIGVEWKAQTVDSIKAGDPSTVVTGIVTTNMATVDVLRKAAAAGANLIITATPTFYLRSDSRTPPVGRGGGGGRPGAAGNATGAAPAPAAPPPPPPAPPVDAVYAGKNDVLDKNKLVVFRLNDHWNLRRPEPRGEGLALLMGWKKYQVGTDALQYEVPAVTLEVLAKQLQKALGTRGGIRAIGDRTLKVQRIGLLPGTTAVAASVDLLPKVDVIIAGEIREWETAPYVQDVVFTGVSKGFISVGRVVAEDPGMQVCATWLKTVVPEVPVRHISAGDPYWRPL